MKTENSTWESPDAGLRKFLSREITYRLHRALDPKVFDVVMEGQLDCFGNGSDPADVVVYKRGEKFKPCLAIEICTEDQLIDVTKAAKRTKSKYGIDDFLIFHAGKNHWYTLTDQLEPGISSHVGFLNLELNRIIPELLTWYLKNHNHPLPSISRV